MLFIYLSKHHKSFQVHTVVTQSSALTSLLCVGTRLQDIPVFMCPVCGAAKDQFVVVVNQPE